MPAICVATHVVETETYIVVDDTCSTALRLVDQVYLDELASRTLTIDIPPFNLSLEQGGMIAGVIALAWVVGFAFGELARFIQSRDKPSEE